MTDELRFGLQLGLNLIAILLAGWLAGRYAARRISQILAAERQHAEEAYREAQAKVLDSLPSIPPELEQLIEIERWVLTARDLQHLLASLGTLVRIRLRVTESAQSDVLTEIDRSLKFLGRRENRWLSASLTVTAYVRQVDPAKGKASDQSLETWISRLNQAYVQAAQSLRRAASLCEPNGAETHADTVANAYLSEANQATATMGDAAASALDRMVYLKDRLPARQVQQINAALTEHSPAANVALTPPESRSFPEIASHCCNQSTSDSPTELHSR